RRSGGTCSRALASCSPYWSSDDGTLADPRLICPSETGRGTEASRGSWEAQVVATENIKAEEQKQDEDAILRACDRFVSGHGKQDLRVVLAELAGAVGEDERPDVYGSGPLIEEFEKEIAELLGREAALFCPSGTMAQQIA